MRHRILQTFLRLIERNGIRSINMDRLAGELGVSKKTLYLHFENKDALVEACLDQGIGSAHRVVMEVYASEGDPVSKVAEILGHVILVAQGFSSAFVFDLEKFHPASQRKVDEFRIWLVDSIVAPLLVEARAQGMLRGSVHVELFCEYHFSHIRERLDTLARPELHDLDTLFEHAVLFALRGILQPAHVGMLDGIKLRK